MPRRRENSGPTTLSDVARRAGVDISVVSRVLSRDPALRVRNETRDRVLRLVEEMGYRPNLMAKGLRTSRTNMIGLIIPSFTNPVYAPIITGAERAAAARGLILLVGSEPPASAALENFSGPLGGGRVDALLVAGGVQDQALDLIRKVGAPGLLVNRRAKGATRYVLADYERAARMMVEHLIELGHERIGHIAGPVRVEPARRRQAGYLSALAAAGIKPDPALLIRAELTVAGGAAAMRKLLTLPNAPTAVFAGSVTPALGALQAARSLGWSVPDDVSVAGVHDIELLDSVCPGLTTVRTPLEEMGERAVELVCSMPPTARIAEVISEPMELVVRQSTGPPR